MYNKDFLEYQGYHGTIEYSKEDRCFYEEVINLEKDAITYEGQNFKELEKDFEGAIEDYLNFKRTNNERQQTIHMDSILHGTSTSSSDLQR